MAAPSIGDAAVLAKTGKPWAGWFEVLDGEGAASLDHRARAKLLSEKHGVPRWWNQMVAVEYERARGLRARHQMTGGYSVAISKTLSTSIPALYRACADATRRRQWFPTGAFAASSQTANKYFRGAWRGGARVEIGFYDKRQGKAQIAIQVSKLARHSDVERERRAWKAALAKLQVLLE